MRVLDPAEVHFEFRDAAMFEDIESGREIYVDPETVRRSYLERFEEHASAVQKSCANLGVDFYQFTTDRPLELALFDFVNSRMRRGRQIRRGRRLARQGGAK
jgi:uncharacterized protein (DUF58 family)